MGNPFGDGGGFQSATPPPGTAAAQRSALQQAQDAWAAQQAKLPGMVTPPQSQFEQQAGVSPAGYQGVADPTTGKLLGQYSVDPFAGEASQRLRSNALSTGPTEWAQQALKQQGMEQNLGMGRAGLQAQQAQSQARAGLQQFGGLGSGAKTSLAREGMRNQLSAEQGVGAQGALARYGIGQQDAQTKQALLGGTADVERAGQSQNLQTLLQNLGGQNAYNANRYNQQMGAWGAKQTADATRAAGSGGKGGGK